MKFFTLVILPLGAGLCSEEAVAAAVRPLMWPFRDRTSIGPEHDEAADFDSAHNLARWDAYSLYPGKELDHYGYAAQPPADPDAMLIVPVSTITADDLAQRFGHAAIVTPAGEWIDSPGTRAIDEAAWRHAAGSALARCNGHHGVLLFCHG